MRNRRAGFLPWACAAGGSRQLNVILPVRLPRRWTRRPQRFRANDHERHSQDLEYNISETRRAQQDQASRSAYMPRTSASSTSVLNTARGAPAESAPYRTGRTARSTMQVGMGHATAVDDGDD